jgi:hypothetical protein
MMNCKGFGNKWQWPYSKVLSQYLIGGTEKGKKNLSQDSWCSG